MVEFKVPVYADRERLIMALVNSGYTVKVEERKHPTLHLSKEYFVQVLDVDKKEMANEPITVNVVADAKSLFYKLHQEIDKAQSKKQSF